MIPKKHIVVLGGGTSGWMTAAAACKELKSDWNITVIEPSCMDTIGVGEATIPHIKLFNDWLEIDEKSFISNTDATFKLGIHFKDWGHIDNSYCHPFDEIKHPSSIDPDFYNILAFARSKNIPFNLDSLSLAAAAGLEGKFALPRAAEFAYAYHIDASKYASLLKAYCLQKGAKVLDSKVTGVNRCPTSGNILSLTFEDSKTIAADFFVDCSGFSGVLSKIALKTKFRDWSKWLVMDRAIAYRTPNTGTQTKALTESIATHCGWRWKIPLQTRIGNGYVYSSQSTDSQSVVDTIEQEQDSPTLKQLSFTSGCIEDSWNFNCAAIGLSSGFLEPLESTSIYLIQIAAKKLVNSLKQSHLDPTIKERFNNTMSDEYQKVRDFIILHYKANSRTDSELWNYCREMDVPDSLSSSIQLYKSCSLTPNYKSGLFLSPSWHTVMIGQHMTPNHFPRKIISESTETIKSLINSRKEVIDKITASMPYHSDIIDKFFTAK